MGFNLKFIHIKRKAMKKKTCLVLVFYFPWATKQTTNLWLSQEFSIFSIAAEFIQTNHLSYTDSKLVIYLIKKVHIILNKVYYTTLCFQF